ncbi:hypothetical protein RBB50_002796 [Rhinocladiella similis]
MYLSAVKVALILAVVSAQVGAIPAPSPQERGVGSEGHPHDNWQGGAGGMGGGHPGGSDGQHGGPGRMGGSGDRAGGHGENPNGAGFRGKHGPSPDEIEGPARRDMGDGDKFRHGPPSNFGGNGNGNGGGGFHRGGMEYVRKPGGNAHGPMPEEEFNDASSSAHLERRHDYIQDGLAGWKWWQKQPSYGKIPTGNPNAGVIDMKDDPIFDRLPQKKRDVEDQEDDSDGSSNGGNEKRWFQQQQEQQHHRDGTPPEQLDHTFYRDFKDDKPGKMVPKGP